MGYSWFRTTIICLALLLEGMSSSSINVQITAIRDGLGLGRAELAVIVGAFLVSYAGLLPAAGQLVDTWSRRATFALGVALFGVGCLTCAVAFAAWPLVLGRFAQGVGAALSAPAALALITAGLGQGRRRNRAVALYGAMGAVGFSLGLVLPGFVVAAWGWRISFLIFLPVVGLVLVVALTVPRTATGGGRIDLVGTVVLTAALMLTVTAIGAIGSAPGAVLVAACAVVAGLVVVLVRRGGLAGFPVEVVCSARVNAACVAQAAVFAGVLASMYVVSLSLQLSHGADAFAVGLAILPQPIAFTLLSGLGARLVTRFGPAPVVSAGMLLITAALGYLGRAGLAQPGLLMAMALIGGGLALCYPAVSIGAVDAVPERLRGTTAGMLTTWQNVGGATGLAVVTALAVVPEPGRVIGSAPGMVVSGALVMLGGLVALALATRARQGPRVKAVG